MSLHVFHPDESQACVVSGLAPSTVHGHKVRKWQVLPTDQDRHAAKASVNSSRSGLNWLPKTV